MAIPLKKNVSRVVDLYGIRRPVVISLLADSKEIEFREQGCRASFRVPLGAVFARAIVMASLDEEPKRKRRG